MRRILNSFLQFIEQDSSESIIIVATNNQKLLDQALFRRFDDVLHYSLPTKLEVHQLLENKLVNYDDTFLVTNEILESADGLSHAEIVKVCDDAIKAAILDEEPITKKKVISLLKERHNIYSYKEA